MARNSTANSAAAKSNSIEVVMKIGINGGLPQIKGKAPKYLTEASDNIAYSPLN